MTDIQQKSSGKVVKFGTKQLANPTPNWIRKSFDMLLLLCGLWAIFAPSMTHIPNDLMLTINQWILGIMAAVKFIVKYFGWDYKAKN